MKKALLAMIRFYQRQISPHFPAHCRFTPTCSQYAWQAITKYGALKGKAITKYGALKGTGLAIWRILRCNPFCKGGYDPVP